MLECDAGKIMEMECLKSFSPIFKIILGREGRERDEDLDQSQFRKRVSSLTYGRDDPVLKRIHSDMKAFLQEEQDCMEGRVRRFEEEQRQVYADLQARAHRERSIIFRLISTARESSLDHPEQLSSPPPLTASLSSGSPPAQTTTGKSTTTPRLPQSGRNHGRQSKGEAQQQQQQQQQRSNNESGGTLRPNNPLPPSFFRRKSVDEDEDMFGDMDGFEQEAERVATPLSHSDEDSAFTDGEYTDSFRDDVTEDSLGPGSHSTAVAHSVPISMPAFSRKSPKKSTAEQDEDRPPISYEKMAASIQALALSCHDTGMFGDLPKPRLNSIPWRL